MNWKVNRDTFYKELLPVLGEKGIAEAGFFEDAATKDEDVLKTTKVLCTPLSFLKPATGHPCILLTTGSFCPLHPGHINMMEKAKEHLEKNGYNVIGGFISPGHDEYISAKNKEKAIPIHYRIRTITEMIKNHDWLSVDPWEGMFCKVAVNFTDVYIRLEAYISEHLKKDIPIFFVSGGDNARFALTFMKKGNCVIVNRPPYDDKFEHYKKVLKDCPNIHFVEGGIPISSTELRKEAFVPDEKKNLLIRVENTEKRGVLRIMYKYFNNIEKKELHSQKKHFYGKMSLGEMISLDSLLKSVHNLKISRSYDIFGAKKMGFTNRPGTPSLEEQLSEIENGEYTLFDDDIHSGSTMRFAKSLIEGTGSKVKEVTSLNISPDGFEILDSRDFFIGGKNNGLVIKMPDGKNVRAPYVYPYVCPFIRGSIDSPMQFSIDIWKMNMDLFEKTNQTLGDMPFLQDLFKRAGFSLTDSMYDICKWHHDYLVLVLFTK